MNELSPTKLEAVAASLIERLRNAEFPFITARRYLDELKGDPGWSTGELSELRLQVVRQLIVLQEQRERVSALPITELDARRA